jgi:hypothetical protein
MLPPFIIDQIRRREEEERLQHEQPRLELPVDAYRSPRHQDRKDREEEEPERGVIILDLA